MRTTIELREEHRARLLELAARRGEKGFSRLVAEALDEVTAVGRFELQSGVRDERKERRVRELLAALPVLPLDGAAADAAATVRRRATSLRAVGGNPPRLLG